MEVGLGLHVLHHVVEEQNINIDIVIQNQRIMVNIVLTINGEQEAVGHHVTQQHVVQVQLIITVEVGLGLHVPQVVEEERNINIDTVIQNQQLMDNTVHHLNGHICKGIYQSRSRFAPLPTSVTPSVSIF